MPGKVVAFTVLLGEFEDQSKYAIVTSLLVWIGQPACRQEQRHAMGKT